MYYCYTFFKLCLFVCLFVFWLFRLLLSFFLSFFFIYFVIICPVPGCSGMFHVPGFVDARRYLIGILSFLPIDRVRVTAQCRLLFSTSTF